MNVIHRSFGTQKVTIANGASAQGENPIDCSAAAGGLIRVPATWTAADIGFVVYGTAPKGGISNVQGQPTAETGLALYDKTGTRVKITTVPTSGGGWMEIPAQVFMGGFFSIVSLNTGTGAAENQGGDREVWIALKS